MADCSLTLIRYESDGTDELAQPIRREVRKEVIAIESPISRTEFYSAGQIGIRPDFLFTINPCEYFGEEVAEFVDQYGKTNRLSIYRTYERTPDELELYCQFATGLTEEVTNESESH